VALLDEGINLDGKIAHDDEPGEDGANTPKNRLKAALFVESQLDG
jgi:hypothetical protein